MDVILGFVITLAGIAIVLFSKRIAKWETKIFPDSLAPLEPIGLLMNIAVGVGWVIIGVLLIFNAK